MKRQKVIDELLLEISNNVEFQFDNYREYVNSIFEDGFIGFNNYTNEELEKEYLEIFNEIVIIIE